MPPKPDDEDEAFRLLMNAPDDAPPTRTNHTPTADTAPRRPIKPPASDLARDAYVRAAQADAPRSARMTAPTRTPPKSRPTERERRSGISISPAVGTGVLMVVGGLVWLGVGLAVGVLFFYPIILVVLGLAAVVKGLLGFGED